MVIDHTERLAQAPLAYELWWITEMILPSSGVVFNEEYERTGFKTNALVSLEKVLRRQETV